MKKIWVLNTAMLSVLILATATLTHAQHEDKGGQQGKPARRGEAARPTHERAPQQHPQQQPKPQPQRQRAEAAPHAQPQQRAQQVRVRQQAQRSWQQHRATNFARQSRSWQQRGGYSGYRVPDVQFRSKFGAGHSFVVFGLPFLQVGANPRFQYGGYWFSMMDPYPEYWGDDWYRNDQMYVDYSAGGYYLYDRRFPGRPGVAISISM